MRARTSIRCSARWKRPDRRQLARRRNPADLKAVAVEEIGLGAEPVLVEDGIIERNGGGHVLVVDEKRLCADANYSDRDLLETGWLPPPR